MKAIIQRQYASEQKMWRIVFKLETKFDLKNECFGSGLSSDIFINGEKTNVGNVYEDFKKYFENYRIVSRIDGLIEHYGLNFEEFSTFLEVSFRKFSSDILSVEFSDIA